MLAWTWRYRQRGIKTSSDNASPCPRCGAVPLDGKSCLDKYHEILALEFQDPSYFGAVHHITVTCYNIQHPDDFSDEAITWMRSSLKAAIVDGISGPELLEKVRKQKEKGLKVRRRDEPPAVPLRTQWTMTVMDVRTDSAEIYNADIRAWAKSVLKDLDIS